MYDLFFDTDCLPAFLWVRNEDALNNMKDIQKHTDEYKLEYITTGDILFDALDKVLLHKKKEMIYGLTC